MRLILIGPPGAGKGTQCKRILERYSLNHLSSGDILRSEIAKETELGLLAKGFIEQGKFVPDNIIVKMMIKVVEISGNNYILDGFPRTLVQAEELGKSLSILEQAIDAVVLLQVPDEVLEYRLTGRRSCPACGQVYHIKTMMPEVENICDKCQTQLIQRKDDNVDVIKQRLVVYHDLTVPLIGYYKKTGTKIFNIDADKPIDGITKDIVSRLDTLGM